MFRKALLLVLTITIVEGQNKDLRLLLIGKTGTGKSTTGNAILGRQQFPAKLSASSVTKKTEKADVHRFGRHLTVVDTPGFLDTKMSENEVLMEIGKCHDMTSPGLHAVLFVIEIGPRVTEEDDKTVKLFLDYFGDVIYHYVIVVFTRHSLDSENINIEHFVKNEIEDSSPLKSFLARINNRFIALGKDVKVTEIKGLLKMVDSVVEVNNGKYYTNKMYQAAAKRMHDRQVEEKRKLQEKRDREIEEKKKEEKENHNREMQKIQQKIKDEEIAYKWKEEELRRQHEMQKYKNNGCHHKHHGGHPKHHGGHPKHHGGHPKHHGGHHKHDGGHHKHHGGHHKHHGGHHKHHGGHHKHHGGHHKHHGGHH